MNKMANKRKIKQIFVFKIIMNNFSEIDFAIKTNQRFTRAKKLCRAIITTNQYFGVLSDTVKSLFQCLKF